MRYAFLLLTVALSACSHIQTKDGEECTADVGRCALEKHLHSDLFNAFAQKQTDYLVQGLLKSGALDIVLLLQAEDINELLQHYRDSELVCPWGQYSKGLEGTLFQGNDAIQALTPNMQARVLLMLNYLANQHNVEAIGALIERDLADIQNEFVVPTEIGGIVSLDKGVPVLVPITSMKAFLLDNYYTQTKNFVSRSNFTRNDTNSFYEIPDFVVEQYPHIARFHLHATRTDYENKEGCGPSMGYEHNPLKGDVGVALERAKVDGQFHMFVFSNIATRTFSAHYLGVERISSNKTIAVVIDLPIHIY